MVDLLIYEKTLARLRGRLAALPRLTPLVMHDDGALTREGRPLDLADAAPEIAFASSDVYAGGPTRAFMIAMLKSTTVRWMQSGAAGYDDPIFARLAAKGIRLTNTDASRIAIAEYVMAAALDAFQRGPERRALQAESTWRRLAFREISGSTWLVIGFGGIGTEVARRATAFGARVIGVRRTPRGDEPADETIRPGDVPSALPRADVVVLSAPASDETRHLVDRDFLAAMKPGAVLINVARGALVDEAALLESLERGVPETAVLDVFETEPLPGDSPLWRHPRVRATAHGAGRTEATTARGDDIFLENLGRWFSGAPLRLEIDPVPFGPRDETPRPRATSPEEKPR